MIEIPKDKYQHHLTRWFEERMHEPFTLEEDNQACDLLHRLSKAQMREHGRGDKLPYIATFPLSDSEKDILLKYTRSDNIQIRAYCNDVCHNKTKGLGKHSMRSLYAKK